MMKKTKLIRGGIMALFVLAALLLVFFAAARCGKRGRKMQYVKVFWKKKSKKFTARTGGKFAVNDSFLEKKFVENYFKKAKSQHGKVLINVKGCDIKTKQDSCGN